MSEELPHHNESERAILNAQLLGIIDAEPPAPRIFFSDAHKEIAEAMVNLYRKGESVDQLSVDRILGNKPNRQGHHSVLSEILNETAIVDNPSRYEPTLKAIKTLSLKRESIWLSQRIAYASRNGSFEQDIQGAFETLRKIKDEVSQSPDKKKFPEFISAKQLTEKKLTPPPDVIKGVLRQGEKAILQAPSKASKTMNLLYLVSACAEGSPWFGFETQPTKILYVNFELPEYAVEERIRRIAENKGLDISESLVVWNLRGAKFKNTKALLDQMLAEIKKTGFKPELIVIDPIYKIYRGRKEVDASEMAEVLEEIDEIQAETGASVIFAHHYSKGNKSQADMLDRSSGSGVFARDVDCVIDLLPHEEEGCFIVSFRLRTQKSPERLVIYWNGFECAVREELDPDKPKSKTGRKCEYDSNEILDAIKDGERLRQAEIARRMREEFGWKASTAQDRIKKLKESGKLALDPITSKLYKPSPQGELRLPNSENEPF